jgi:hypothetical protein
VAVLRGYQAEIIGEVDPLVAGRSALDSNIRQNREDAGEAVAGQIERAQAPKDVGADLHATRCPAATADTTIGEGAGGLIASVLKAKESEEQGTMGGRKLGVRPRISFKFVRSVQNRRTRSCTNILILQRKLFCKSALILHFKSRGRW